MDRPKTGGRVAESDAKMKPPKPEIARNEETDDVDRRHSVEQAEAEVERER